MAQLVTRRLSPAYASRALDLITETFTHPQAGEPLSSVMGLRKRSWREMAGLFVERASQEKLSFVVVNDRTDELQGVMINEDWKQPPPNEFRALGDEWRPAQVRRQGNPGGCGQSSSTQRVWLVVRQPLGPSV